MFLQQNYDLDPADLTIVGSSYGAELAFSMTNYLDKVGGIVSIAGAAIVYFIRG